MLSSIKILGEKTNNLKLSTLDKKKIKICEGVEKIVFPKI